MPFWMHGLSRSRNTRRSSRHENPHLQPQRPADGLPVTGTAKSPSRCIGAGADVGTGAIVLPGCRIGRSAVVGAGAVVTKDVPDCAIVVGVPARVIRYRGEAPLKDV